MTFLLSFSNIKLLEIINKTMTPKKYHKIRFAIIFATVFIFSQAFVFRNYFIAIITFVLSSLVLLFLRKKVVEIMADERDYQIGGKSALLAIKLTSCIGLIVMIIFHILRDKNPFYEPIAMTLASSICVLTLSYSVIFEYYSKHSFKDEKRD